MSPVFKSGAFIQQCFAVHPLCLGIKIFALPNTIGILCTNCHMRHRITMEECSVPIDNEQKSKKQAAELFSHCTSHRMADIRLSGLDVVQEVMQFRCEPCKKSYRITFSTIESHQK